LYIFNVYRHVGIAYDNWLIGSNVKDGFVWPAAPVFYTLDTATGSIQRAKHRPWACQGTGSQPWKFHRHFRKCSTFKKTDVG